MTISNQTNRISAVGAAAVLEIPYVFPTTQSGDLKVIQRVTSTGVETELTENATSDGYTATYGSTGGTVTTSDSIAATDEVHVIRNTPMTQLLDLVAGGNFNPERIESAFDKVTKLIIEKSGSIDRNVVFPATDPSTSFAEMPNSINRKSKNFTFDATGAPTASVSVEEGSVSFTTIGTNIAEAANAAAVRILLALTNHTATLGLADLTTKGPRVDIRAFGALEATADNATVIQSALDSLASGGSCFVPQGTFISSQVTVPDNVVLEGAGRSSILKLKAGSDQTFITNSGTTGMGVKNLTVDGNKANNNDATTGFGINFDTVTNSFVSNCYVHDCDAAGIRFVDSSAIWITDNYTKDNDGSGIEASSNNYAIITNNNSDTDGVNAGSYSVSCTGDFIVLSKNTIKDADIGSIHFGHVGFPVTHSICIGNTLDTTSGSGETNAALLVNEATYCVIGNNTIKDGGSRGILVFTVGKNLVIENNNIYNCAKGGIRSTVSFTKNIAIIGNIIDTITAAGEDGIVLANCDGFVINDNIVVAAKKSAIRVGSDSTNGSISGNIAKNSQTSGGIVLFDTGNSGIVIEGNICYDDQSPKTQTYGIIISNNSDGNIVKNNIVQGNLTGGISSGTASNNIIEDNIGADNNTDNDILSWENEALYWENEIVKLR